MRTLGISLMNTQSITMRGVSGCYVVFLFLHNDIRDTTEVAPPKLLPLAFHHLLKVVLAADENNGRKGKSTKAQSKRGIKSPQSNSDIFLLSFQKFARPFFPSFFASTPLSPLPSSLLLFFHRSLTWFPYEQVPFNDGHKVVSSFV